MSQLKILRSGLNRLRRRRKSLRWFTGYSALLVALLWMLVAVFLVDWLFLMNVTQRTVSLSLGLVAVVWAFFRFTYPFLGIQEDQTEMALLVERNQDIDSDIVAAIQFETETTDRWGSRQLANAVVGYVSDFSTRLNVFHGMSYQQVSRRVATMAATLIVVGAGIGLAPDFAQAFINRMMLGETHYPTKTRITQLVVGGVEVLPGDASAIVRVPFGRPVMFEVTCGGELPESGQVKLVGQKGGIHTEVALKSNNPSPSDKTRIYIGELPRLIDSVNYQVFIGDAYTDTLSVNAIPLPVIDFKLTPTPPSYAAHVRTDTTEDQSGLRQIAVIEGSSVDLAVTCKNKLLKRAWLKIDDVEYELAKNDASGKEWILNGKSPLSSVTEPVRFEIQVEDEDGLSMVKSIQGYVRLKADRPPRVFAMRTVKNPAILPVAEPRFGYGARDDYGISKILLHVSIQRIDLKRQEDEPSTIEVVSTRPGDVPNLSYNSTDFRLDLEQFNLEKGDELKLEFEAFDYRGSDKPKSSRSEALVLQVTDAQGLLLALSQADELSAEQMDQIIERELSIGRD
ncbi:MAG: hypothetical protein O3A00_21565 [Planctomycetota bacterium]|nr:hypothetical protein [Planctomycetota bacterium]